MKTDFYFENEYINYAETEKTFHILHQELELGH
jgi:hypothetical protein